MSLIYRLDPKLDKYNITVNYLPECSDTEVDELNLVGWLRPDIVWNCNTLKVFFPDEQAGMRKQKTNSNEVKTSWTTFEITETAYFYFYFANYIY